MVENIKEKQIGIVLLAAGESSRLGKPKQLLLYKGQTLLQHTLNEALTSNPELIVVVLGANAETLQKDVAGNKVHVAINTQWPEGMASSIRTGIKTIIEINPSAYGVILLVCDQPFINAGLLNDLITAHQKTNKEIVACNYGNAFGPPVFFHQSLFPELLELKGDIGARSIIQRHTDNVEAVSFPGGAFDIDTEADYEKIKR
jgi:molybdenum cofactor cytidylyltransferase